MEFTKHFKQMLEERTIHREWVEQALQSTDNIKDHEDGTRHFIKQFPEYDNRWLRVVINVRSKPNRAITAFFDRRLRKTKL